MCAIAGMINLPAEDTLCEKMLATMYRRGPDDRGVFRDRICTLLHARLSIIDPEGGIQPMSLCWEGEEYTIVYNGELYNAEELRRRLLKLGHVFAGYSDTEVLLHSYTQWKDGCLDELNGIFAFAVWEKNKGALFLARDPMGVKPLFYMYHCGGLLFASEMKTILCYPSVQPKLDAQGAAEILLLGPGRTPGSGVFYGIEELEPGCFGYYHNGRFLRKRYWKLRDREHKESFEETAEIVRDLVMDSIRRQMVSDVPIGTFLSGGLDSSLITAVCATELAKRGECLSTFSVDYENQTKHFIPDRFQPESDNDYIKLMQRTFATDHHWTVLDSNELVTCLDDAVCARDLPGMADVDASLVAFCKHVREHVKVALSGECADEIFGGYPWYRDPEVRAHQGFPWAQNVSARCSIASPWITQHLCPEEYIHQRYLDTCRESDILPENDPLERRMKEMVNLNTRWFMQTLLDRKDRMSMYWGLEVRVPFCDRRIAEYLYSVPWRYKDYNGKEKGLLRHAMEGILPPEVLYRKKSPYPKTYDPGYLQKLEQKLAILLQDDRAPLFQIVNKEELKLMLEGDFRWPWYGQLMKRPQTIAYFLQVDFWLRKYRVDFV